jgi:hypothetical protein
MKRIILALTIGLIMFSSPAAFGTIILDTSGSTIYQQTTNNPCVIGDPSCNQGGFNYTYYSGTPDWSMISNSTTAGQYDLTSPVSFYASSLGKGNFAENSAPYRVVSGPNTAVTPSNGIPSQFTIGIDINYIRNEQERLVAFYTYTSNSADSGFAIDNSNSFLSADPLGSLLEAHNGNGFSDSILTGFDIAEGKYVYFRAVYKNDNDGMEEFFIIPSGSSVFVPEPGMSLLLGLGLLGVGLIKRKIKK